MAYVRATNEKQFLREHLESVYLAGDLPIKPTDVRIKNVLDLGCGTGANLEWLIEVFRGHNVEGIDRSRAQLSQITIPNAPVIHSSFEDFEQRNYDFVLASHVLQYINTDPRQFIAKVHESLDADGEAWFVQQTRQGMYQIIGSVQEYLEDPQFKQWLTFEDYERMVDELGISYSTHVLSTSFEGIDFANPTPEEKLRLEFMLCLKTNFDASTDELKQALARLPSMERIKHPNGIIKIRKR